MTHTSYIHHASSRRSHASESRVERSVVRGVTSRLAMVIAQRSLRVVLACALALLALACTARAHAPVLPNLPNLPPNLHAALSTVDVSKCPEHKSGHRRANTAGNAHLKRGAHDTALACYVAALSSKMNFPPALYGVGETFARRAPGGFELARESFELALRHWPEYADAAIALGDLWSAVRGDRARAETYYARATKAKPGDALSWEALASNQYEDGRFDDALASYNEALNAVRQAPGLYFSRGKVHRAKKDYGACVEDAQQALKLAENFGQAYHLLATCEEKLLGVAALEVDAHYRAAIEHEPEFADHFLDFVHFIYRNDESRLKEAREILSKAHASMEDNGERAKLERGTREFEEFASRRAHDNSEL